MCLRSGNFCIERLYILYVREVQTKFISIARPGKNECKVLTLQKLFNRSGAVIADWRSNEILRVTMFGDLFTVDMKMNMLSKTTCPAWVLRIRWDIVFPKGFSVLIPNPITSRKIKA